MAKSFLEQINEDIMREADEHRFHETPTNTIKLGNAKRPKYMQTYKTEFPELARALEANKNIVTIAVTQIAFHDWALHLKLKSACYAWIDAGDESAARDFDPEAPYFIRVYDDNGESWEKNMLDYDAIIKEIGELQ